MKRTTYILLAIFLFAFSGTIPSFAQFKVIGYLPTWMNFPASIGNVQLTKVTHINIAFANPNGTGTLIPSDGVTNGNVATVVNAAHAQGVKVFMSIGGAGAPGATYASLLSSQANINSFVTKIVSYATTNNLDGIDVDIEGDILDGSILTAAQYQSFVTTLGSALHAQNKLMSAALASWFSNYVTNTAAAQYDWINLMSYDEYGPWSGPGQHSPMTLVQSDFNHWNVAKGVPASKLVIGVPFYGYGWGTYDAGDEISYCEIVSTYPNAENLNQIGSGNDVIYYNGMPLIRQKTSYALANASGIMIWEIAEDCNNSKSLVTAIDQVIHPLPVELISFTGKNEDQKNFLSWLTANETNSNYFDVERSADGVVYEVIGNTNGTGNSHEINSYSFIDINPLEGANYYRLAEYDLDGTVSYRVIVVNTLFETGFEISPNPFENTVLVMPKNTRATLSRIIQVSNLQGALVYETQLAQGVDGITIGGNLDAGVYFIKILDGESVYNYKVVKK